VGTALADLLASNGHDTTIWALETDVVTAINARHENQRFLRDSRSRRRCGRRTTCGPPRRGRVPRLRDAVHHLRRIAAEGEAFVERDAVLSVATKGIERGTLALMTSVVGDEVPGRPVVGVSGPSFASEVAARQPTAIVAASVVPDAARITQDALSSRTFRVYTNDDVIGVELGGALKNVMAVATGIVEGWGWATTRAPRASRADSTR
jgi:glycerol-3-phosphate dehydrogenase (NAD(P)+)